MCLVGLNALAEALLGAQYGVGMVRVHNDDRLQT